MKEIIQLSASELLHAVSLWLQRTRPELCNRYERISGNPPVNLTFELSDERRSVEETKPVETKPVETKPVETKPVEYVNKEYKRRISCYKEDLEHEV
ncbi:hypothetical protein A2Z67_05240 [Candidatus Woesebacteria bacterium RBG_13_36_22]|uniref:Uncharacterized protein n=1 Tax=Candidatus Woesebacteria bacterium RBG_13_36_22 TaxID=1802478 RepID=A0A1F7X2V2_9BACT|nr:MAG: hypothetical protein A2Z67_05240 [Candidatus Woesebacteria bacterium RBG_13_36_22]